MDRVRLGRVLGRGTRLAARTVYEAVDAATSTPPGTNSHAVTGPSVAKPAGPRTVDAGRVPRQTVAPVRRQSTRPSMFAPVKRASRAVSLELTGSFFGLFAFAFAVAAWHSRAALSTRGEALSRFVVYCAVMLIFAYFSVSNFVRARRLQ